MSTKGRKVKYRAAGANIDRASTKRSRRQSKDAVLVAARRLNKTRTRRLIIYSIGCLLLMQLIRYIIYSFIYVGSETPSGTAFTVIIYLQTGLMVMSLGLLVAASITYLNSLRD